MKVKNRHFSSFKFVYLNRRIDFWVESSRYPLQFSLCQRFLGLTTADHISRPVTRLKFMAETRTTNKQNKTSLLGADKQLRI